MYWVQTREGSFINLEEIRLIGNPDRDGDRLIKYKGLENAQLYTKDNPLDLPRYKTLEEREAEQKEHSTYVKNSA